MRIIALLILLTAIPSIPVAQPLGTGFTYQGQLMQNGAPASGEFDFEFQVYDVPSSGIQISAPLLFENQSVSDGVFSVELDFGTDLFAGNRLWLETNVRDGSSVGGFFGLFPRQELTPAPFAVYARFVEMNAISGSEIADNSVDSEDIAPNAIGIQQIDSTQVQRRISGSCPTGSSVRTIADDGSVGCQPDADTTYSAGTGLVQSGSSFNVDIDAVQSRISGQCSPGLFFAGVNQDGSVFCQSLSAPLTRTLDSDGSVGRHSSIAVRVGNLPIISHYDQSNADLKIYDCANASCASGTSRTLDSVGDVGLYTNIALRQDGRPIISYYDFGNDDLKVYRCNDSRCTAGSAQALDTSGNVGNYTHITIRNSGLPIISYNDTTNGDLKIYSCNDVDCNAGVASTLVSSGQTGFFTSIAIGQDGNPIISYFNSTTDSIHAFVCSLDDCSGGIDRTLDSVGATGAFTDIAVRSNGLPVITYYDSLTDSVLLYDCSAADCSSGTARTLAVSGAQGRSASVAVRDDNRPIVAFNRGGGGDSFEMRVIDCGNPSCSVRINRRLISAQPQGFGSSIAVRTDGLPIVTFHEDAIGALRVHSCGDENCEN